MNPAASENRKTSGTTPKSRFQQTVCLAEWWLVKAENDFQGRRLVVEGFTRQNKVVRAFSSAPILKRYDVFNLETADGICVIISGLLNKDRSLENGFPSQVCDRFVFGFPSYWDECIEKFIDKETSSEDISGAIPDHEKPSSQSKAVGGEHPCESLNKINPKRTRGRPKKKLPGASPQKTPGGEKEKLPGTSTRKTPQEAKENLPGTSPRKTPRGEMDKLPGTSTRKIPLEAKEKLPGTSPQRTPWGEKEKLPGTSPRKTPGGEKEKLPGTSPQRTHWGEKEKLPGASPQKTPRREKRKLLGTSPESLGFKRSRSGRLLMPTLEFWRNQRVYYDADQTVAGVVNDALLEQQTSLEATREKQPH